MKQHSSRTALPLQDRRFLRVILSVGICLIAYMPFHSFVSTWLGTAIGPLWLWKSLPVILVTILTLCTIGWMVHERSFVGPIMRLPLVRFGLGYVLIALLVTALSTNLHSSQTLVGLGFGLRYMALFAVMLVCGYCIVENRWRDNVRRVAPWLVVVLGIGALVQVTVLPRDFLAHFGYQPGVTIAPYSTIDDNHDALRAFVTLRGPNDFGAYLVILLTSIVVLAARGWLRYISIALALVTLYLSSSRSAWLGAIIALITLYAVQYREIFGKTKALLYGGITAAVAVFVLLWASVTFPVVRLAVFHSSPGDSSLTEGSTDKHWHQTGLGIARVVANPFGCGLGCAGPASFYGTEPKIAENYFVQVAEETGIVGLALWLVCFGLIMKQLMMIARSDQYALWLFAAGIGLTVVGLWLHVWADDTVSLTWWGLTGLVIGQAIAPAQKNIYNKTR